MAFFGFDTNVPQPQDSGQNQAFVEEDVAVYTWGDVSYDTLGDALQEAGDDLNDETFGGGPIGTFYFVRSPPFLSQLLSGKDFDFSGTYDATRQPTSAAGPAPTVASGDSKGHSEHQTPDFEPHQSHMYTASSNAWTSNDPNAALPKYTSHGRVPDQVVRNNGQFAQATSVFSRLDPLVATRTEQRQSIPAPQPMAEPPTIMTGSYTSQPRTMAEIEADMRAAAMQQQHLAQQKELARIQMEQQMLAQQQRLQEEERIRQEQEKVARMEQERLLQIEQQARQDPLWAIRQAMMEQKMASQGNVHEKRASIPSETSPAARNRQANPAMQAAQMGHNGPAQQQMMLQELLYHQQQQQQQFLEQQLHAQQHTEKSEAEFVEAQRRIQEAELLEAKHRRRVSKIQSMVRRLKVFTPSFSFAITVAIQ
jgi:DNA topoisomerase 2-associated protein PAT1